jgi:hypothetical protein
MPRCMEPKSAQRFWDDDMHKQRIQSAPQDASDATRFEQNDVEDG